MRLIVNLSMLGPRPTGLGVYAQHCADVLFAQRGTLAIQTQHHHQTHPHEPFAICPDQLAIGGGKLSSLKRALWLARLPLGAGDLVYSPTHHGIPLHRNQIITVHDLICLKFPRQNLKQYLYFRFVLPRVARRCRAVFTVSNATKRELIRHWHLDPDKVHVVPNVAPVVPVEPAATPGTTARGDKPYLLVVGAGYPHKNLHELLQQHRAWADRYRLQVVSCSGPYRAQIEALIAQLGLQQSVTLHDYVSADQLLGLYRGCTALVYPSLDEGFGIPPLEALAHGKPVIASDIPVHREVLADSALFVTLGDAASWAAAFRGLQDRAALAACEAHGRAVLARYQRDGMRRALLTALMRTEPALETVLPFAGEPAH